MGWSSRQVWGFTGIMVGVIVMTMVGMVTVVLIMVTGSPPQGSLLELPTTQPPTTTPEFTDSAVTCAPTPDDALVFLPDHCMVTQSSRSSLQTHFNMRRCSNHMCASVGCHGDRCCCQVVQTTVLSYQCPNERSILVPDIVEKCGCVLCADMPVVFVGMVTDTKNNAIPLASVTVEVSTHNENHSTSEEGLFGFSVPASQETVTVVVRAVGFSPHARTLPIMPGEVNVLRVSLLREVRHTVPPVVTPILVNVLNLAVFALSELGPLLLQDSSPSSSGETFIELPAGSFLEETTLVSRPVDVSNADELQSFGMSFVGVASEEAVRRKRRWSGRGVMGGGEGGKVKREGQGREEEMLFVLRMGEVEAVGEDGERVGKNITGLVVHFSFPAERYNCSDMSSLKLYLQEEKGPLLLPTQEDGLSCSQLANSPHIEASLPHNTSFPLTYLLAAAEEEGGRCHVAVRAFLPTSTGNLTEIVGTTVWLLTRDPERVDMVNVMFGKTRECISIPCRGELTIRILDGPQYSPESYTVPLALDDKDDVIVGDVIIDDVITGEVYTSLQRCEEEGLGEQADQFSYFQFVVKSRSPLVMQPPSENDTHLTMPPFCSLRVGVALPVDMALVHVTASSDGGRMVRVVQVGEGQGGGGEEERGSGVCTDCEESHIACLEVSCDNQAVVTASGLGDKMVCVGVMEGGEREGEGVRVEGGRVTVGLGALSARPRGLVVDPVGPDRSVSMEMCRLGVETDVRFRCYTSSHV